MSKTPSSPCSTYQNWEPSEAGWRIDEVRKYIIRLENGSNAHIRVIPPDRDYIDYEGTVNPL